MTNKMRTITNNKYIFAGALAIMLAALLWSLDGLFIRPKLYALPAALVVFWEHLLGFIVLSPFVFINWSKIKSLSRRSWGAIIWVSVFGGLIGTIMITKAFFAAMNGETTFATVVILQKLQPIFALLLARIILREKLPKQFYFWALLAVISSYFIAFAKTGLVIGEIDWRHSAAIFAFLAAFAFGSSTVFGKRAANHLDYRLVAALRFGLTSVLALGLILINGDIFKINQISPAHWGWLVLIVFSSGAAAMFLYYFGLKRVSASTATILELFWPLSAIVLDYVFNKNYLSPVQILAVVVLLIAFFRIASLDRRPHMSFRAKVIRGLGQGHRLGYPTANLDKIDLDLPHGIYTVRVMVRGKSYQALMHFGFREIFSAPVSLEILIKDFNEDIYGEEVAVEVVKRIRGVKKFKSTAELVAAIKSDWQEL